MQTHAGNRSWQPFCGRNGAEAMLRTRRGRGRGGTGGRPRVRSSAVGDKGRDGGAHRHGLASAPPAARCRSLGAAQRASAPLARRLDMEPSSPSAGAEEGPTRPAAARPLARRGAPARRCQARPPRQRTPPRAATKPGCREPTARGEQKQRRLGGSE